ncbi:MAG: sulfatase-like hydrolase/transferase [Rubripirellula sp.]
MSVLVRPANAVSPSDRATEAVGRDFADRPNILFVLTDDHRWDALRSSGNDGIRTPHLDSIAHRGVRFTNAFVTLAICSPSRAACLTGRYGSANGVTSVGKVGLDADETTFAKSLHRQGYRTGVTGKWHLKTTPEECGFDFVSTCWSNGTWYDRKFQIDGTTRTVPGFVDDVVADESIRFLQQSAKTKTPFVLWMCTQVPHMDHKFRWPAKQEFLDQYDTEQMPLPASWNDDLSGKPEYLLTSRNRTKAMDYGYQDPNAIRTHTRDYYAAVQQMDAAVGRVFSELEMTGLAANTWVIVMGDNGWMLGEHGMTSKVLPYEESMHVPLVIAGPQTASATTDALALNIDITATIYQLAGLPVPDSMHGQSLLPLLRGESTPNWRSSFLYEAPTPQLGSQPLWAVRDARWKYIETETSTADSFPELYDLQSDKAELVNVAQLRSHQPVVQRLSNALKNHRKEIGETPHPQNKSAATPKPTAPLARNTSTHAPSTPIASPEAHQDAGDAAESDSVASQLSDDLRRDLKISGIYPHLTTYGVYSQNGAHRKPGHNECGIGAVVPWAGKLWMVNYAPHQPRGSEHKLFSVDADLQEMTIHPESVGGTPAGRMIHHESNQLLIAHYLIDAEGKVRVISPGTMPMRVTAIARHLTDPENMVYYVDMEGSIWEADVHTLAVEQLFKKPVPGWHGKGGYTGQGRLIVSNNGEHKAGTYDALVVGGPAKPGSEEAGVLAQWDGKEWQIIERRQFTDITGPNGIAGGGNDEPIWAIGWDRRSLRLKLLDQGEWHTYLLPKASLCNEARHGWYTEWPRIREIGDGRWMMDMHGMFFDFPSTFSASNSAGLRPIASHLRYVPDFCHWNNQLVLASDETSIQGNKLAGQPQSNLWFGDYEDLKQWGPCSGYGGPWIEDEVPANVPSDPFLIAGFDRRILHLATGRTRSQTKPSGLRASDEQPFTRIPDQLAALPRVTVTRGSWHQPALGYSFQVNHPVTVYLAVDRRGEPKLEAAWEKTNLTLSWGKANYQDHVFRRDFAPGTITIPGNATEHTPGAFGMPHTAFIASQSPELLVTGLGQSTVTVPEPIDSSIADAATTFRLQVDRIGNGQWDDFDAVTVPIEGYVPLALPRDLEAVWLRLIPNQDCVATAFLHQTASVFADGTNDTNQTLFAGLANADEKHATTAQVYAAQRNRNLRLITGQNEHFEFSKDRFSFDHDTADETLRSLLEVEPEFSVDGASVILEHRGGKLRLPKGHAAFDKPFESGWPRMSREVESERHLANIHGTFYEVPLITNGAPPAYERMRPVSSHAKQITDFCSWNGLLVLAGIRENARPDGHVFVSEDADAALWFGGIDDLWKLGKPVGHGGPWFETEVKRDQESDPYLMTGYDKKTLFLSHQSKVAVSFDIEVDVTSRGHWRHLETLMVQPGEELRHDFPDTFQASWIRLKPRSNTIATAQLLYE